MKRITHSALALLSLVIIFRTPAQAAERVLSFAVPGVVAGVSVKPGMKIKRGAVLAVLDRRPLIASSKAGRARVEAAKIRYQLLARRLEQTQQLYDSLSASSQNVEDAKMAAASARSDLAAAKARAAVTAWRLERATLRAPFAGTVASVPAYPGMVIPRHGDAVAVVVVSVP